MKRREEILARSREEQNVACKWAMIRKAFLLTAQHALQGSFQLPSTLVDGLMNALSNKALDTILKSNA